MRGVPRSRTHVSDQPTLSVAGPSSRRPIVTLADQHTPWERSPGEIMLGRIATAMGDPGSARSKRAGLAPGVALPVAAETCEVWLSRLFQHVPEPGTNGDMSRAHASEVATQAPASAGACTHRGRDRSVGSESRQAHCAQSAPTAGMVSISPGLILLMSGRLLSTRTCSTMAFTFPQLFVWYLLATTVARVSPLRTV